MAKKAGRHKDWYNAYRNSGRREKNKKLRIGRHLKKHPNDRTATKAFQALGG